LNGKKTFFNKFCKTNFFTWHALLPALPFWANYTPKTAAQSIWFFYSNRLVAANIQILFFGLLFTQSHPVCLDICRWLPCTTWLLVETGADRI